jgi:hypothetical protein
MTAERTTDFIKPSNGLRKRFTFINLLNAYEDTLILIIHA